jgi:hypothetical protein
LFIHLSTSTQAPLFCFRTCFGVHAL